MRLIEMLRKVLGVGPPPTDEALAEIERRKLELKEQSKKHVEAVRCARRQNQILEEAVDIVRGTHTNGHAHH
jgi:hypothetical protein